MCVYVCVCVRARARARPPGGGFRAESGGRARSPPPAFPGTAELVCVLAGGREPDSRRKRRRRARTGARRGAACEERVALPVRAAARP